MKFDSMDELMMFIPEDDADIFNLGKIAPHFSCKKHWETKKGITRLKSICIHAKDLFTILCMLLEKNEHHFIKRDL